VNQTVTEGRRRQAGLLAAMDREWPMIVAGGDGRRAWRRWAPELCAGIDGPDELVAIIRHGDHARSDAGARVLLAAAQASDELAARALMQGLVPFVGRLAGLYARYGPAPIDEVLAAVLAAAPKASARFERHLSPLERADPSSRPDRRMSLQADPDRVTVEPVVDSHHSDDRRAPRAVRNPVDNGRSVGAWSVSTAHLDRRWGAPIRRGFTGRNRLTHYAHLRSLVTGNQLRHDRRAAVGLRRGGRRRATARPC
jgi:hypothetical protein